MSYADEPDDGSFDEFEMSVLSSEGAGAPWVTGDLVTGLHISSPSAMPTERASVHGRAMRLTGALVLSEDGQ